MTPTTHVTSDPDGAPASQPVNPPRAFSVFSAAELKTALKKMYLIRRFEEAAEEAYQRGLTYGTMHLSIGQEASAVGACLPLGPSDYITSTHRGHGHCIAKGADPKLMFAEFSGKETGYCHGRGGSMHIADVENGNLGANGIVAGGIPIAVGAALSIKKRGLPNVALSFFGDGAANEGAFHEALNIASIWKLPVIFVCENNKYAMSTSIERALSVKNVADRAVAYSMPGVIVDGNSVIDMADAVMAAMDRAHAGLGPTLIESKTYRLRGHSRSDRNRYRTREEIESWAARDPIGRFEGDLIAHGLATAADCIAIREAAEAEIAAAVQFSNDSPLPSVDHLLSDVYTPVEAKP
ncbi:MAG: thiamine pyrophosphate-dependent dehydrogenase E1 component subunit alpha [Ancalomicrobiaceae bacterium]|nr:thiamine pyrophosphate-dependent dehydrogenase E1 component subunit alpha [Ancalomicrobiaceae bacterium]